MKVEFLENVNEEGDSIIRLFSFNKIETEKLINSIQYFLIDSDKELNLLELDFVEGVNCGLKFLLSNKDTGIKSASNKMFICSLKKKSYLDIIHFLTPFLEDENGYQWLYDIETNIELLYSKDGTW